MLSPEAIIEVLRRPVGPVDLGPDQVQLRLEAALDWIGRAQDRCGDGGISWGYSIVWNRYFRARGWLPAYPETTGYLIPTLLLAAHVLNRPNLADRARSAADWEIGVQLASGAVRGGVVGEPESPAIFNTGQVLLGWLAVLQETGEERFSDAAYRASEFLVAMQDGDGDWTRGHSRFAARANTLYNARTAWALAEAGKALGEDRFTQAASRYLGRVVEAQHENGWLPRCCLDDADRPLLHTLAYAYRGLLEGGRVLGDESIVTAGRRGAMAVRRLLDEEGRIAGRLRSDWTPAVRWTCLTGIAQMANVWLRAGEADGDPAWRHSASRALSYLAGTQRLGVGSEGVRGGIHGSDPIGGGYGPYQVLSWATKFFADGLMRLSATSAEGGAGPDLPSHLRVLP